MIPRMPCPGCDMPVRLCPPRAAHGDGNGRRRAQPWRRAQHYVPGTDRRCRHTVLLTDTEIAQLAPMPADPGKEPHPMHLTVFSARWAEDIKPGAIVDDAVNGVIVVDEATSKATADSTTVSLYGRPPGATTGRRVHLQYSPHDTVRELPDGPAMAKVMNHLTEALRLAARAWDADHDGLPDRIAAPWASSGTGTRTQLEVTSDGKAYQIEVLVEPVEPEPPADEPG